MTDTAFDQLDRPIQKWIHQQGWEDLRPLQKNSIPVILAGNHDVLISASTAAGKTEAAFLPAICGLSKDDEGVGVLYISPLKALINDQQRRLQGLCELMEIPLTAWHGDAAQSKKNKLIHQPGGVLLITPESLESLLLRKASWVEDVFKNLKCIVIDEYHAFLGTERGIHLLSLMHRIEHLVDRLNNPIPRIALSATLGNLPEVMTSLRSSGKMDCVLIEDTSSHSSLKILLRGYTQQLEEPTKEDDRPLQVSSAEDQIAKDLFIELRGTSNLVFANSRARTESLTAKLTDLCESDCVPNEFFAHHGSLSKDLRHQLESRLQREDIPTTAIATMTLELGIDVGKVSSIAQVTSPHSVSSLRQRLGRSGRRGGPAILQLFITEDQVIEKSHLSDILRLELVQCVAMVRLLVSEKWYEPADMQALHLSTLFHQILAMIAQWGGVRVDQFWELLVVTGPFKKITPQIFEDLIRQMGEQGMVRQIESGELVLGIDGEKIVDHYTFYSVFHTPEEYRVIVEGKTLGTLPIDVPIIPMQTIIFAGKRWQVLSVNISKKTIELKPAKGGKPPKFSGGGVSIHPRIHEEMFKSFMEGDYRIPVESGRVDFLDADARELWQEGHKAFMDLNLNERCYVEMNDDVFIIPWAGSKVIYTLSVLLQIGGLDASVYADVIEVKHVSVAMVRTAFERALSGDPEKLTPAGLSKKVLMKCVDKYDHYLSESLLDEAYGRRVFDIDNAKAWIASARQIGFL